jgi:hypothetical protein
VNWINSPDLRQGQVNGSCDYGNELLCSMNSNNIPYCESNYQLLGNETAL